MIYASRANAEGHHAEAMYEVDQIEGLVFWDDDEAMTKHTEDIKYGLHQEEGKELQGQEEEL